MAIFSARINLARFLFKIQTESRLRVVRGGGGVRDNFELGKLLERVEVFEIRR